eukprot:IDg7581t1
MGGSLSGSTENALKHRNDIVKRRIHGGHYIVQLDGRESLHLHEKQTKTGRLKQVGSSVVSAASERAQQWSKPLGRRRELMLEQ